MLPLIFRIIGSQGQRAIETMIGGRQQSVIELSHAQQPVGAGIIGQQSNSLLMGCYRFGLLIKMFVSKADILPGFRVIWRNLHGLLPVPEGFD